MSYNSNTLLDVIVGPWAGKVVVTTGKAEESPYDRKLHLYPLAMFTGPDQEDPSVATFVQLAFKASESELTQVSKEYPSEVKRRYRGLKITSKENPLVHETEIS